MNKNAGLKERSPSRPTVGPEEAGTHAWLKAQAPEGSGKLSRSCAWAHRPGRCPVSSFQDHVLPIICWQYLQNCEILFLLEFYDKRNSFLVKIYTG